MLFHLRDQFLQCPAIDLDLFQKLAGDFARWRAAMFGGELFQQLDRETGAAEMVMQINC